MNEDLLNELLKKTSQKEAEELLEVANKISAVSKIERSDLAKKTFLKKLFLQKDEKQSFLPYQIFISAGLMALLLFIGFATIVNAQKSIPGESFYPLKLASENVITSINPKFKDEVIVRRSEEIKKIVEQKKDSNLLKETIKEYKKELEYEERDEVKVEESRKNLEQAKEKSSDEDKKEIESVLEQTGHKEEEQKNEKVKGERIREENHQEKNDGEKD